MKENQFRVLIIDKSSQDARLMEEALDERWPGLHSQRVESASSLQAALHAASWDCVLCDLVVDGFSSAAALEILNQSSLPLAIVIVAAVDEFDYTISLLQGGAHGCVSKKNLQRLVPTVELAMQDAKNRRLRMEAENRLKEREALLSEMSQTARIGGWEYDLKSNRTIWTDEFRRICGTPAEVPPSQEYVLDLVHPEDQPRLKTAKQKALEHGEPYDLELRLITPAGNRLWVHSVCKPVVVDGRTVKLSGICQDITARKQAQQALRQSEQRMALLMNTLPYGVQLTDTRGVITYGNAALHRIMGWESGTLVGRHIWDLRPNYATRQDLIDHLAYLAKAQPLPRPLITHNRARDGRTIDIEINWDYQRGADGEVTGFVAVISDITDRSRMESELRRLAQVVEQSPQSIIITNLEAEIEYVNDAFVNLTGYQRQELAGENTRILQSGKTPRETYRSMWAALRNGRVWAGEFLNRRKDGSEFVDAVLIAPVSQANGAVTHYFCIGEDVTEKKQLARELEQHRSHLEQLVEMRTAQLTEAQQRAEAANQSKSAFLANMSHEIRTPMNAIIGFTHLIRDSGLEPAQLERLGKIDEAAEHLLAIINDILDLSKIEVGKLELEHTEFSLAEIFEQVVSLVKEPAGNKKLHFELIRDDDLTWLCGDPTRLRQALLNYTANAVKFTKQGSITLRARKMDEQGERVLVRFEVEDTGIGIGPDKLSNLFLAFEQGDTSTTRQYGGTGLGLAITRRLAQLMEGDSGAQSELGRGSTFWFTAWLRRGQASDAAAAPSRQQPDPTPLSAHILLVDDNAINREVAVAMLGSINGLTVDTANNGRTAVAMVCKQAYDLVLMDVQMPEMDGLEATRQIRSVAGNQDLPILAMTAAVFEEDQKACRKAGMNDFLAKPIRLDKLQAIIATWLPQKATGATPPEAQASRG